MNTIVRQKGGNLRPYLLQCLKRYVKPNFRTYSSLQYNYNAERTILLLSSNTCSIITKTVINVVHQDDYYYSHRVQNRRFQTSSTFFETGSKVDATVKTLKTKQKEKVDEIMKEVVATSTSNGDSNSTLSKDGNGTSTTANTTPVEKSVVKKPLKERIWEEIVHYYHGFRLLFIDMAICSKLLWRVLNGKTLTRRENKLLLRTTSDLFRLIPFSVFIIVPFMELLLPVFIKFFPGMLPSTFQTAKEREDKLRQSLAVRLEMAKFLQRTLDEMPVQHRDHTCEEAKEFDDFFHKIKTSETVNNEDIIKFATRFDDEITLDALSREQLAALCRVLELNTIGTTMLLRFQLRLKLRSLVADDRVIAREGVDSLDLVELQQACKARGMRAYGLTAERLRFQLKEWIDLSLNEKVPPTLLLLSRSMLISDDSNTTDKLKATMRELPDSVAAHTKHAISEREGKVDHKTKIQIIREEERLINEEREEEREAIQAKRTADALKEDEPPYISSDQLRSGSSLLTERLDGKGTIQQNDVEKGISSSDVRLLSDALKTLSSDKKLVVEKETIKELKEELADYKDDVEELREVRQVVKEPVRESRAAKMLYNRVNKMISQLDTVLCDLEHKQEQIRTTSATELYTTRREDFIHIDELVQTIKRLKEDSDETRFKVVEDLLVKLDNDKDGAITVNEIMKVVKSMDSTHNIEKKHLDEFVTLLTKQAQKRQEEELVRIEDLMLNIKKLKETSDEARLNHIECVLDKFDADKDGVVTINDILKVLESIGRENIKLNEKQIEELIALLDKEQILHAEEKIEKAIAKSIKEAEKMKAEVEKGDKVVNKLVEDITDSAQDIKDIAKELGALEQSNEIKEATRELQDKAKELRSEKPFKDTAKELKDCASDLNAIDEARLEKSDTTNQKHNNNLPKSASATTTVSSILGTETALREANERQKDKIIPQQIIDTSKITKTIPPPGTIKTPPKASANAAKAAPASTVNGNSKKLL